MTNPREPETAEIVERAKIKIVETMDRQTRGMTHDGSANGTAHWHVRVRYDDVCALLTTIEALEARAVAGENALREVTGG